MMARAARLHADQAGLELAEKRDHLAAAQRLAQNDISPFINAVNLKDVLGQIQPNGGNLHDGWLLLLVVLDGNHNFGTLRCRWREPSTASKAEVQASRFNPEDSSSRLPAGPHVFQLGAGFVNEAGVERRLTTILAADVVGYSRLMGADEVGTLVRLKSLRKKLVQPKIAGGRGRIVKLMGELDPISLDTELA
jgi:hypothetical protein